METIPIYSKIPKYRLWLRFGVLVSGACKIVDGLINVLSLGFMGTSYGINFWYWHQGIAGKMRAWDRKKAKERRQ